MSKTIRYNVEFDRKKRRAIELYHPDSPFWPKVARTHKKDQYRKPKHRNAMDYES